MPWCRIQHRVGLCRSAVWRRSCCCTRICQIRRGAGRLLKYRVVRMVLLLLLSLLLMFVLHTRVLPSSMGYYNEDCYLQESRKERMRFLLRHVISFLNEENATYWLDFGTFLGAVREGDIIAHDGDMDVSRLADDLDADRKLVTRLKGKMNAVGIKATALTARYQDVQVDLFRFRTTNTSGRPVLRVYYPFVPAWSLAASISDYLLPVDIPTDILFPLRQMSVFGVQANVPRRIIDYMKLRYPLTWYMTFPYKWKCWMWKS